VRDEVEDKIARSQHRIAIGQDSNRKRFQVSKYMHIPRLGKEATLKLAAIGSDSLQIK